MNPQQDVSDRAVAQALGEEIRRERLARGWSRAELVEQLPSGIGVRALLSYEHGARALTVIRLIEISRALGTAAAELLDRALRKARDIRSFSLRVNLEAVLGDRRSEFAAVRTWARNRIDSARDSAVHLTPATVQELAAALDVSHLELAEYLFEFADLPAD